jgi:hypothetical protein
MNRATWCVLGVLLVGVVGGCGPKPGEVVQPYSNAQTFTGTLRSVGQLVGGAPTGWELHIPAGAGRTPEVIGLDVSALPEDAKLLDGQEVNVKVTGRTNQNAYVVSWIRRVGQ